MVAKLLHAIRGIRTILSYADTRIRSLIVTAAAVIHFLMRPTNSIFSTGYFYGQAIRAEVPLIPHTTPE